jgi:hypothetical protein
VIERTRTYKVDLPAPFDPTIARRESRPTSKLARFKIIFAASYPNVTSESWSRGGEIFSVSGKLYNDVHEAGYNPCRSKIARTGSSLFPLLLAARAPEAALF